jgi:mRNA-degrading endonuclease toxin of MazEF toxin-antitoxin module
MPALQDGNATVDPRGVRDDANELGARPRRLGYATLWVALESAQALACSEPVRPDRLPDWSGDDAPRVLTGSFAAPVVDAGAAPPPFDSGMTAPTGATNESPVTVRQTYEGVCEGSTVQWGFFTYVATTPGDSSIGFRVRTAPTEDQLPAAGYVELSTASTAPRAAPLPGRRRARSTCSPRSAAPRSLTTHCPSSTWC